jgi:endonuclease YncB( thermonuclease family)
MKRLALCSVLLLSNFSLATAEFSGKVVSVLDGDTIEVLHNGQALPWPYVPHGLNHKPHSGWESSRGKDSQAL